MKKVVITIGLAALTALSSYGQGYVIFASSTQNMSTNNTGTSGAQISGVGATSGKTAAGAGGFYYALFWSSTITSGGALQGNSNNVSSYAFNTAGWTYDADATAVATGTTAAGRFGPTAPNGDGSSTIPGTTGGNSYNFVVVGWSANLGTSLAAMEGNLGSIQGYLGESVVSGTIATGNGGSLPPPGLFGGGAPSIQGFVLGTTSVVPEPGTMALAALGGASLLMFRRKK